MHFVSGMSDGDSTDVLSDAKGLIITQASCVIVSGFRAALDLDTYPLSNLINSSTVR